MSYVVEVNECRVFATSQGAAWWALFRSRFDPVGRITDVVVSLGGNVCHVAVDSREDGDWLVGHMVSLGVSASAVRVRAVKA